MAPRKVPLDNESRKVLSEACAGLPGKFQDGGFIVEGVEIANGSPCEDWIP